MTLDDLQQLFDKEQTQELAFEGKCHDCQQPVTVIARLADDGQVTVEGGAVYRQGKRVESGYVKCPACHEKQNQLTRYQPCEVYSRVVGYLRPISQWNIGKQAEFKDRLNFKI